MDLRDLAYFREIAATENLGRAAERLGRTKPALTKCLKRLEEEIGAPVVERSGRGIVLTAVGRALSGRAAELLSRSDELGREMRDFASGTVGHIRVGASALTAELLLPALCSRLLAASPKVTFEVVIGMGDVLRTALRQGSIDVVIGSISPDEDEAFEVLALCRDEVVIVAGRGHRLAGRDLSLGDLAGESWLLGNPDVANRKWLDRLFLEAGLPAPLVRIESSAVQVLPRLIAETGVVSVMSKSALAFNENGPLVALRVAGATLKRQLGMLRRRGDTLSPAAETLVALGSQGQSWLPA
jgi:DNA-binding transcriptional LysR family regulator